jgi:hypothetical protein
MKKILASLLSLLMILSFGACAAENGETLPNPITDSTAEEILETLGIEFSLPEGASDAAYSIIGVEGENPIAQVKFTLDGKEINCRIQPAEELYDNTGMYYEWENTEENAAVGTCPATLRWNEDAEGICFWYDEAAGLLYSVSVTEGASAEYLTKLAEMLYLPLQEAASGETSDAGETVKTITDRTLTEDLLCAEALEKIGEDDAYTYYLPCIKSQYIVVAYESGNEETAAEALANGNTTVDDLISAGITVIKEAK